MVVAECNSALSESTDALGATPAGTSAAPATLTPVTCSSSLGFEYAEWCFTRIGVSGCAMSGENTSSSAVMGGGLLVSRLESERGFASRAASPNRADSVISAPPVNLTILGVLVPLVAALP